MQESEIKPTTEQPPKTGSFWRTQEMFLVQEVMSLIGKGLQTNHVLREILHLLSEMLGLNRGRVVLKEQNGENYYVAHAYGLTREEMARGRYAPGEGVTGRAVADGQLVIVHDVRNEPAFLGRMVPRDRLPPGAVSFIVAPIKVDQKIVGALACHRILYRDRALSDDVTILKIMATLIGQLLTLHERVEQQTRELQHHNQMLEDALKVGRARYGIIGTSPILLEALSQIERVASTTANVLLLGQSGTGKELFARALHLASERRDKPFIKVNCGAIPENLFESELFGHDKGAFTGAVDARPGWFEQASGGTIFLDEIGELPLLMQTKLLRTLQEGTITRLGGKKEVAVNTRLVAATNIDLAGEVRSGAFREDLFYRLNVIPISLPSLSERRTDIPELTLYYIDKVNRDNQRNVSFTRDAVDYLTSQPWPGNIRQLSNFIERVVLLAGKTVLDKRDIDYFLRDYGDAHVSRHLVSSLQPTMVPTQPFPGDVAMRAYMRSNSHEAADLQQALRDSGGNKTRAAQRLGLTGRQFSYRWSKLGL